jgi:MoaA/NifB/PqqE/SkfB family radical SAM enzyme
MDQLISIDDTGTTEIKVDDAISLPAPQPSAGIEAYRHERRLCLEADARKNDNYQAYLAGRRKSAQLDYLPIKLDIENVSRCNFRCVMCAVSDWPKSQRAQDMKLADFKKIIDEQYGLIEIKLQGLGEPTLQGDDYFEMIKYARARHIWVRTVTNGSLLHLQDNISKLVASGVNEVQISVDGATKQVFESIRRGATFEHVVANCKALNDQCRAQNKRLTKMAVLVQRQNRHQLLDLVELAADLGFRDLVFGYNLIGWGDPALLHRNQQITTRDKFDQEMNLKLVERGKNLGIQVGFWISNHKYDVRTSETLCPWPFERTFVSSDLRAVPCCMISNPDFKEIGDGILSGRPDGFSATWFGENYANFRQRHLDGNIPSICKNCYQNQQDD